MGQRADKNGVIWDTDAAGNPIPGTGRAPQGGGLRLGGPDPFKVNQDRRAENNDTRQAATAERLAAAQDTSNRNSSITNALKVAQDYNGDPTVKAYRVAISQFAQALNTGDGPQSDLALTYAFAKAMDPESVVRDSEQNMVIESQPWFQATVEKVKKQFGMDGAGQFTPEARDALRQQIANSVNQRQRIYDTRRSYFEKQAESFGIDPTIIVGAHDKEPFLNDIEAFQQHINQPKKGEVSQPAQGDSKPLDVTVTDDSGDYRDSYLGQGMSGVNEGIGNTLGAPVDIMTAGLNLIPRGINAIANTNIPQITDPIGGGQWMKDNILAPTIFDQSADPSKQFTRRVGQSVGASVIPGAMAGSIPRTLGSLASGLGGGMGGATAQQVFPGNPLAEMGGELLGGGLSTAGVLGAERRNATRQMEAAIPTVDDLKQQASELYRTAETRGVTASPAQTKTLRDQILKTLRSEGQIGPKGRITDADTNTTKAFNLIDQYAGKPMRPVEMGTVRNVIAEGRQSADGSDRRLAQILTNQFDDWSSPLAPEFDAARGVASRYLQAQDLEKARELARAGASQFGNSGLENALRTQYRGLDRAATKGQNNFSPPVVDAIQQVSRGTPASNFARNLGRFAPTGPVSLATSVGIPSLAGGALGGPMGGAIGGTLGLAGAGGRLAANAMANRAVDIAELTARNGGLLPTVDVVTPEMEQLLAANAAAQAAKYVPEKNPRKRGIFGGRR